MSGRRRVFKKFSYRGIDLDKLLDMSDAELMDLYPARARRSLKRGTTYGHANLLKKLRKAKRETPVGEKPAFVKTHLRNMVITPEMIGSMLGVYNGAAFGQVEVKPEMVGSFLGEYSITYKPIKHGRPGIGATNASKFIPLK